MKAIHYFRVVKELFRRIFQDDVISRGAESAFYWVLSFFPFLIFLVTLVRFTPIADEEFLQNLTGVFSQQSYEFVLKIVHDLTATSSGTLASFGIVGTIWSASSGVRALIYGLNRAYDVQQHRPYFKHVGLSIIFTIGLGFIIVLTMLSIVFGEQLSVQILKWFHLHGNLKILWSIIRYFMAFSSIFALYILLYYFAPYKDIKMKAILPGALFSTVTFIAASEILSAYFNIMGKYSIIYETIGGIIFLMIWLYIVSTITIIGGELNAILHEKSYVR